MASDIKTKLSLVLLAVRQRLIDRNVLPADRLYIALRMNPPLHVQADLYGIILPLTQTVDVENFDGGSRYNTLVHGRLNVYLRNRTAVDQAYQDFYSLTDASVGILDKLHSVYQALCSFQCDDTVAGDALLEEPMRLIFANEPRKDYDNPEWLEAMAEFEITYRLDLTITTQDQ